MMTSYDAMERVFTGHAEPFRHVQGPEAEPPRQCSQLEA